MKQLVVLGLLLAGLAASAPAQEDSRLVAAVRLAQDGQGDSARSVVLALLNRIPESDTLYPQVVYTMGLVARDANDRARNFRRVAVEFAGSPWADEALLGLAQEDFAAGRAEASARSLEKIRSDYPTSTLLPTVAFWGVRTWFELGNATEACRWLAQGVALAGQDIELANQLNFYAPRCSTGSISAGTAAAGAAPAAPAPGAPAGRFSVQVVAATTEAAAEATARDLRAAGYEPHIVREGGYVKVRVGRFATRAEASAAATQVRAKVGGGPFVVESP